VLAFSLITGSGCGTKPISRETLDYFYGLVNQQYWQGKASGLTLNDEYGTEQLVVAPTGTSGKQQYVVFGDVTVTASSPKSGPTDAVIHVKVFDGTAEKDVRARVDDANRATLEKMLVGTFESKAQRDQRLKDVAYAAKLKDADALLAANKVADAIAAFKAAQVINDTDEVKTRLDGIYLKQGKYYYSQKKYDLALTQLKLVSFDPASLTEAQELLPTVQADADKAAAAAKVAAAKIAAEKAAAAKIAAANAVAAKIASQRRTWFKTLDGYFWEFKDIFDKANNTARSLLSPFVAKISSLEARIAAYCGSHTGMQPAELEGMRSALSSYVTIGVQSLEVFNGGADDDKAATLLLKADSLETEYLRLRGIVAKRYGY
jgi:tetratricopeptide (TPR) repeat protein